MTHGRERARVLLSLGRYSEATGLLASHVAGNPADAEGLRLMAQAQAGSRHLPEALATAQRAVAIDPGSESFLVLSDIQREARDYRMACRSAREAIRVAPADYRGHRSLAVSLCHLRGRRREARRAAQEAVRLAPTSSATWQALGYVQHGWRYRAARDAYQRALALNPGDALTRQNLAALDLRRRPMASIRGLSDALAMDPTLRPAHRNLSKVIAWCAFLLIWITLRVVGVTAASAHPLRNSVVALALAATLTAIFVLRLPASVRRALPRMLLPGISRNVWSLWGLVVGLVIALLGCTWMVHADVDALTPGMVVALGAGIMLFSLVGLFVAIRDEKRRTHW